MSTLTEPSLEIEDDTVPRDRRGAFRVSVPRPEFTGALQLVDISLSGVGFLARREDAPLLQDASVIVHVNADLAIRAEVQRVELGTRSTKWVRVGARFAQLGTEERAALSSLVTSYCAEAQ